MASANPNDDRPDHDEKEAREFHLHWDHIKSALQYQLYTKLSSSIDIEKLKISATDFSKEAIWSVLNTVGAKRKLCAEELVFIGKLVQNAISFDPITQCTHLWLIL